MEQCEYQAVNTEDERLDIRTPWKYFFRQILLASAVWTQFFTAGLCLGTPTVLIPQWTKENNIVFDDEMQSWLYSCFGFSAIPWLAVVPTFSAYVGRKVPYFISSCSMLVVFILLYFSVKPYQILISDLLQGFAHASNITITVLIVSEYVNPNYRGIFLTIKSASFFWGIWVANAIGTFFHWRYIAIAGLLSSLYSLVGAFHPESPHWLASKGKFEKARSAFRWLHGSDERSEKELQAIIDFQMNCKRMNMRAKWSWENIVATITCRQFYLPLGLSMLMAFQYHFSGKLVCSTYAIDMIKRMTGDDGTAYTGMLILDGVTVLGMYLGSFLSKILKRRTLYMSASFIGVLFLLILALYLHLVKLGIIADNNTVAIVLLTMYSVSISCGPMIMSMTVTGEITPIKFQALCYSIQSLLFSIVFTLLLKFAPLIFTTLGMDGSFLFYGITSGVCLVGIYIYLPETKDKTLLEIEEYFKDRKEKDKGSPESNDERTAF